jgi:hypothetical protein
MPGGGPKVNTHRLLTNAREDAMTDSGDKLVPPWGEWRALTEEKAIARLDEAVGTEKTEAARLAIIAVGNYAYEKEEWPVLLQHANDLLDDIEGTHQSKRWG